MNFRALLNVVSSVFTDKRGVVHTSATALGSVGMSVSAASARLTVQAPTARLSHTLAGGSIVFTESSDSVTLLVEDLP